MEMLGSKLLRPILNSLEAKLQGRGESRELTVCGGGALLILNIIDRQTRDIDVITPELDPVLKEVAAEVGQEFGLEPEWLNNGPASLSRDLESEWESRTQLIYPGHWLKIFTLSNRDLLASKLYAYCDRDASDFWPARVEKCLKQLVARLTHAEG